jgi:site-specific DNA-cytosine methylase
MGFFQDEINLEGLSDTQCYKLAGNGWAMRPAGLILKELLKNEHDTGL